VPRGTAVCLNAGVWHHAPMVKGVSSRVVVIFKEKTSSEDNTLKDLNSMDLIVKVVF
jgi:ureidoglycolate hydrolase